MAAVRVLRASARAYQLLTRGLHGAAPLAKLVQFNLSDIGEGIREVTVKSWAVQESDVVAQFDEICEVESDKATVSITSRYDGRIARRYHAVGDKALVGRPLVDIEVADEEGDDPEPDRPAETAAPIDIAQEVESPRAEPEEEYSKNWNKSLATPAVRRIAMEHKIRLKDVQGSGKHGRVMKEDMLAHLEKINGQGFQTRREPLNTVQKVMTMTMTESLKIPQFVFSDEVNVSKLVLLREEVKDAASKKGIKLSYLPFFVKALSKGLSEYPILNSSLDVEREEVVYKSSHNIGIAVDSPCGLVVPNVKNVQGLSVAAVARELNRLQDLAARMRLSPADFTGGTFSISNIGTIGGTTATPVILPPEVGILAVGRIQRLPRFDSSDRVVPVHVLSVSWSADHRLLDGATVARCSEVFRYYLEHPSSLLLDL